MLVDEELDHKDDAQINKHLEIDSLNCSRVEKYDTWLFMAVMKEFKNARTQ